MFFIALNMYYVLLFICSMHYIYTSNSDNCVVLRTKSPNDVNNSNNLSICTLFQSLDKPDKRILILNFNFCYFVAIFTLHLFLLKRLEAPGKVKVGGQDFCGWGKSPLPFFGNWKRVT